MDIKRIKGYVHSHDDALLLVHGIRLGLIKPTLERPTMEERESIRDGSIYCFRETSEGMKRWTDGKIWSPSKILGHFLLYKEVPRHLSKSAMKKEREAQRYAYDRLDRNTQYDEDFTLHKRTISIIHENVTYHVIAYFQPFFDKKSISKMPFFAELQNVILSNKALISDQFVNRCIESGDCLMKKYNLPEPRSESFRHIIDRAYLEKNALLLLQNRLRT